MVKQKQITRDVPYYRHENRTQHTIRNLESCTLYNVTVVPSNLVWNSESNYTNSTVHTVSTLPEKVSNLEVEIRGSTNTVFWTPPFNSDCIKEYKLVVNKSPLTTTKNYINVVTFDYCEDVAITPISLDNSPGETVHILKPGPVQDISGSAESASVTVSWLPPLNNNCVDDYIVRLNDNVWSTKWSEFTFEDLVSCTEYELQVAAKSIDNTTGSFVSFVSVTLPPQEIGPPENFTAEYEDTILTLNWEPPENAQTCNVSYTVRIIDNKGNNVTVKETSENLQTVDFSSAIGCVDYTISITPHISSIVKNGQAAELNKKISKVRDAPTCNLLKTYKTSAMLECNIGSFESNLCSLHNLAVVCSVSESTNQSVKVKLKEVTEYYRFKKNPLSSLLRININHLSAFTNYSCTGYITNTAGQSLPSVPISFRTMENVPAVPQLVQVVDITNTSFMVKWLPPEDIQGNLVKYNIGVEYKGPYYFVPVDCTAQRDNQHLVEVDWLTNEYIFTGALPASTYSVYVQGVTGAGPGEKAILSSVVTQVGVPDEPRNVDFVINKTDGTSFDVNVTITWLYPCYTNGILKHFKIVLFHTTKDLENIGDEVILPMNSETPTSTSFASKFKLLPAYDYIVTVTTVTQESFESSPVKLTFTSPETYPEPPTVQLPKLVDKRTFVIEWNEPRNRNGVLTNYTINIINEGALYNVPKDCIQESVAYKFIQSSDVTSFKFEGSFSYRRYKVTVAAATKIGYGLPSDPLFIETVQSEPEEVRDARLTLTDTRKEDYDVTATVTFKYPCNTNGPFKQFLVNLFGSRTNYPIHKSKINFVGYIDQDNSVAFKLLPSHNYLINIEVQTEQFTSEYTSIAFSSPAGVPPSLNSEVRIPAPTSHNGSFTQVILNRNMFSQVNGPILYYAVIIAPDLDEVQPGFGVWDGINWPQVEFGFSKWNVVAPYQASMNFWNPFDGNNLPFYTFIVGDTSLSKTNIPLQPNSAYKVLIRGFTQNGYRDSPSARFAIPGMDDSDLALIIGLTCGIVGTIVLVIIALIFRKRHRWLAKQNSVKLVPLTPLSVSTERFPEYYTKIKNSSEMLKEEFMLLTHKSNALGLPTYEALRPENKKKNRYTNILPYDKTRVKLINVDEKSDYINASYIQGYSGKTEYIASQGPLEHTCIDFWEMVTQENSSLIVMITQFIELNKQKCYKYFPDNHENMELGNGLAIRCCTELSFKSYTVRTLLVQKDLQQWTITHLQYTEWPDFGCPEGTQNMLEFSQLIREHAERNQDPIIVHCSAGVGRTGTLIALDILFQALSNKDDIDVFGTVLNLRKDRKNMVQTEKQYLYIHECVSVAIANPERLQSKRGILKEAIYENVEDMKNGITESVF